MKLLHIFSSFGQGGVPLRIVTVANALGNIYAHHFITLDDTIHSAEKFSPTLNATAAIWPDGEGGLVSRVAAYRRFIKSHAPDVLLTYNWGAIEWTMAGLSVPGLRQIHFESGFGQEEAHGQIARRKWTRRFVLPFVEQLVVPSYMLVDCAVNEWKLGASKILRIPNGVDLTRFNGQGDSSLLSRFNLPDGAKVIGSIAPLRPEKNLHRLVETIRYLPENIYLLIVGDGLERPFLEKTATETGCADRVKFFGHSSEPEKLFPLFDVFAMTSATEQMPNSLLQAMASGLPVVATDVGDIGRIVSDKNVDYIMPWQGAEDFAGRCVKLVEDPVLLESLSKANLLKVQTEYALPKMVERYNDLFRVRTH